MVGAHTEYDDYQDWCMGREIKMVIWDVCRQKKSVNADYRQMILIMWDQIKFYRDIFIGRYPKQLVTDTFI